MTMRRADDPADEQETAWAHLPTKDRATRRTDLRGFDRDQTGKSAATATMATLARKWIGTDEDSRHSRTTDSRRIRMNERLTEVREESGGQSNMQS